jgi:hypothetical protein
MNEERTGKCLWQVQHIRCHLWHRYSITVDQVMVETVKLSKWWLQLNQKEQDIQFLPNNLHSVTRYCQNIFPNMYLIISIKMILSDDFLHTFYMAKSSICTLWYHQCYKLYIVLFCILINPWRHFEWAYLWIIQSYLLSSSCWSMICRTANC